MGSFARPAATITEGRRRLVPAQSITDCMQLLGAEYRASGDGHETSGGTDSGGSIDSRRAAGDNHGCFRWHRDLLDVDDTGGVKPGSNFVARCSTSTHREGA